MLKRPPLMTFLVRLAMVLLVLAAVGGSWVQAQDDAAPPKEDAAQESTPAEEARPAEQPDAETKEAAPETETPKPPKDGETPKDLEAGDQPEKSPHIRKLMPDMPVWIDTQRKMVIMDGEIALRAGSLEMFACLKGTKEHESVVAIPGDAFVIHAGLLAVGATQGKPVIFEPEYKPPSGDVIDVLVQWKDKEGKTHNRRAQDWVRNARTKKAMRYDWVFPGSYFWIDVAPEVLHEWQEKKDAAQAAGDPLPPEPDGRKVYAAEGGELICVSNFRSSMMDVPVPSTQENANLWFEAFTENIPPEGTKVRVFLIPNKEKKPKAK